MKDFNEFKTQLRENVFKEIVQDALQKVENVEAQSTEKLSSAVGASNFAMYFSINLLEKYHEWLHK